MHNEQEVFDRVEGWLKDIDSMLPGPYNTCNLEIGKHSDGCDGNCVQLNKWELAVAHEKARWRRLGANPESINVSGSMMFEAQRQLHAVVNVLIAKGLVTEQELADEFLPMMYRDLAAIREQFTKELAKKGIAARRSGIEIAQTLPSNLKPPTNGKP
jgi:hypothetical protein